MTIQQQDAMWPEVQRLWETRDHRKIARGLADLLGLRGKNRCYRVMWACLDVAQSREAFFARLAQMRKWQKGGVSGSQQG